MEVVAGVGLVTILVVVEVGVVVVDRYRCIGAAFRDPLELWWG